MTQSLFGCIGQPALPEPLTLGTPLGTLLTAFCSNETGANESLPQKAFSLGNGARLNRFDASIAEIEVVTGLIRPDIPSHLRIGGCRAALWRVRAHEFVAAWAESSSGESASTWFAVEQPPTRVYEQLIGSGTNAG
jgi:hypothetical protein